METRQIIIEFIEAYGGYPDRAKISRSLVNFLRSLDREIIQRLYHYIEKDTAAFKPMTMERLTLAIGHFQALNDKIVYEEGLLPSDVEKSIGIDKFRQCKKICIAAGRCNQVLKEEIIGSSPSILEVKKQTWHACFGKELISSLDFKQAIKDLNVLISGETGTGKELFAKAVQASAFWHDDNNAAPTASVNVAAFTEGLIDSELFGHKKGAFTGAMQDRDGLLRASHNGTFFLDEVGDLPMGTQVKLLRVIETKKVRPVGSDKEFDADVRYISATNKNILKDKFRGDLYERLAGTVIHLPSLRERSQQDIEEIADVIIRNCLERKEEYSSSDEVIQYLRDREKEKYTWPGNVRELQSFIRGVILGINIGGKSGRWAKPKTIIGQDESEVPSNLIMGKWTEEELKQWYYNKVLALNNNNLNKTARVLNVNPTTLLRRRGKSK